MSALPTPEQTGLAPGPPRTRSHAVGLVLLGLSLAALPLELSDPFQYEIAILICLNATICVGLNLLVGYAGQISLGHAGFYALGMYVAGLLSADYDVPAPASLLAGMVVVGLLAFAVARPILRLRGHYLAMGTLGLGVIIAIVLNQEVELTGGPDGHFVPFFQVLGWELFDERIWYAVFAGLLFLTAWGALNIIDSPIGRALRAIHGSEIAAQVAGVNIRAYKAQVFVFSAVLAGLCGGLYAFYSSFITPAAASFGHSIELVTMVVLGGLGSTFGAILGAALLTLLPQLLAGFRDYEMIVFGAILIGTMIFLPKGLVPSLVALVRGRRS